MTMVSQTPFFRFVAYVTSKICQVVYKLRGK